MNSIEKPPDAFVCFIDENLGTKQLATALRQTGAVVEISNDHFPSGTDMEFLEFRRTC